MFKRKNGFTIFELLVVMCILMILCSVAIPPETKITINAIALMWMPLVLGAMIGIAIAIHAGIAPKVTDETRDDCKKRRKVFWVLVIPYFATVFASFVALFVRVA